MSPTKQSASDSFNEIATVRIELPHTDPVIWRQVEVPTSITLKVMHDIIQIVMGWWDYHSFEFRIGKQRYGLPIEDDWADEPCIAAAKVRLRDVLKPRKTVIDYLYDFGDSWEHRLTLTKVRPGEAGVSYPRYIGGKRNAPPEDCGGIPGFYELLEVLADPAHPSHADLKEWAGDYDPPRSIRFRSNTPSAASQTAATLPRRASPGNSASTRRPRSTFPSKSKRCPRRPDRACRGHQRLCCAPSVRTTWIAGTSQDKPGHDRELVQYDRDPLYPRRGCAPSRVCLTATGPVPSTEARGNISHHFRLSCYETTFVAIPTINSPAWIAVRDDRLGGSGFPAEQK